MKLLWRRITVSSCQVSTFPWHVVCLTSEIRSGRKVFGLQAIIIGCLSLWQNMNRCHYFELSKWIMQLFRSINSRHRWQSQSSHLCGSRAAQSMMKHIWPVVSLFSFWFIINKCCHPSAWNPTDQMNDKEPHFCPEGKKTIFLECDEIERFLAMKRWGQTNDKTLHRGCILDFLIKETHLMPTFALYL